MKLHLPFKLRAAVLSCVSASLFTGTTMTAAALGGGVFVATMGLQAQATTEAPLQTGNTIYLKSNDEVTISRNGDQYDISYATADGIDSMTTTGVEAGKLVVVGSKEAGVAGASDQLPLNGMTVTLQGGQYSKVSFVGNTAWYQGSLDGDVTLNIDGSTEHGAVNVEGFGSGLFSWTREKTVINSNITFSMDNEGGSVGALNLTGEANSGKGMTVTGNITANIITGTVNGNLIAGAKGVSLNGNVTYHLGSQNSGSGPAISGDVIGSLSMNGNHACGMVGNVEINMYGGTFNNVYGVGVRDGGVAELKLDGTYTVNYYGGTVNGVIATTANVQPNVLSGTITGATTLNLRGELSASKVALTGAAKFATVNVDGAGTLLVAGDSTIESSLAVKAQGTLKWAEQGMLTMAGDLFVDAGAIFDVSVWTDLQDGINLLTLKDGTAAEWLNDVTVKTADGLAASLTQVDRVVSLSLKRAGIYWIGGDNQWTSPDENSFSNTPNGVADATFENGASVDFVAAGEEPITVLSPTIVGEVVVNNLKVAENVILELDGDASVAGGNSLVANGTVTLDGGLASIRKVGTGALSVSRNIVDAALTQGLTYLYIENGTLGVSDALSGAVDWTRIFAPVQEGMAPVLSIRFADSGENSLKLAANQSDGFQGTLQVTGGVGSVDLVEGRVYDIRNEGTVVTLTQFSAATAATVIGNGAVSLELKDDGGAQLGLADGQWTGTAVLSGTMLHADMGTFGNASSKVVFDGLSGTVSAGSELAGAVEIAQGGLTVSNADAPATVVFQKEVTGSGKISLGSKTTLEFNGDISGYSGVISGAAGAGIYLNNRVNNTLGNTFEGNVSIAVGNGTGLTLTTPTTITGDLTMESGSTLTLVGDGSLTLDGTFSYSDFSLDLSQGFQADISGKTVIATAATTNTDVAGIDVKWGSLNNGFVLEWQGNNLVLVDVNMDASTYRRAAVTRNGAVGATMLDAAFGTTVAAGSDLEGVLKSAYKAIGSGESADGLMAQAAGASAAALGAAFAGDMQRQLRAIRNRTTTMGVSDAVLNERMPYFNAWVNAEGNYLTQNESGTAPGYDLSSWGGTVGVDVDINPSVTCGIAFTAMYGDFSATGLEQSEGDLDTYYVTLFARYSPSSWVHTFVLTGGLADTDLERTVSHANGSYQTRGDTTGAGFGLMYEVGYTIPMNEDASACWQPILNVTYVHSALKGYTETGSDMAIRYGDQKMDALTLGVGLRAQAEVGENLYNRTSVLEGRALFKCDVGDRRSSLSATLSAMGVGGEVVSAESGACGVEIGAGISIPLGQDSGSLFIDTSLELRKDYTNVNGTVGYRINF